MTAVFVTAIICITITIIASMAYQLIKDNLTRKGIERHNSALLQLEQDLFELSESMVKFKALSEGENSKLKERIARMELNMSGRRHS